MRKRLLNGIAFVLTIASTPIHVPGATKADDVAPTVMSGSPTVSVPLASLSK